jgi:hypothetical protein
MKVAIGTDCIGSCKSNYHAITTTTSPLQSKHNWKSHTKINVVNDKWNISVVICDTDVLCFILYTQENTFLIIFNLYIYMTTFFISVVDNHEARLCAPNMHLD